MAGLRIEAMSQPAPEPTPPTYLFAVSFAAPVGGKPQANQLNFTAGNVEGATAKARVASTVEIVSIQRGAVIAG